MADDFSRPLVVQRRGNPMARRLLALLGWQVRMEGLPALQGVLIAYPHTSNWDFPYMLLVKWAVGLPIKFWAKESLFAIPFAGYWLRRVGGVPVKRGAPQGAVGEMVRTLQQNRERGGLFWLALSPEGTRKLTTGWRSGFYQVAYGAGVPLGICCVNYKAKTVDISHFFQLSGDVASDMQRIRLALAHASGRRAELASPIKMIDK
jgi:1-acyl-sn-glycerol-3-phosphate acyltransferase